MSWPITLSERFEFVEWQADVAEGNTFLGFRDWVDHQEGLVDQDARDHEETLPGGIGQVPAKPFHESTEIIRPLPSTSDHH